MPLVTYWEYLKLESLLVLQSGLDEDETKILPDELHFIIVHQVFELWFKLILKELRIVRDCLSERKSDEQKIPAVLHRINRINKILSTAVQHWDVMETMPPQDFLDFRDKLFPASGFQSFQFPEIEILMGLEEAMLTVNGQVRSLDHIKKMASECPAGAWAWNHIEGVRKEQTLRSVLHDWLYSTDIQGSTPNDVGDTKFVQEFLAKYLMAIRDYHQQQIRQLLMAPDSNRSALEKKFANSGRIAEDFLFAQDVTEDQRAKYQRLRAALLYIESNQQCSKMAWPHVLIDALLDMEELVVLWRTRHARMAERVIGRRIGTGGSSVSYLDETLSHRVFTELWAARTQVLPRHLVPPEASVEEASLRLKDSRGLNSS